MASQATWIGAGDEGGGRPGSSLALQRIPQPISQQVEPHQGLADRIQERNGRIGRQA